MGRVETGGGGATEDAETLRRLLDDGEMVVAAVSMEGGAPRLVDLNRSGRAFFAIPEEGGLADFSFDRYLDGESVRLFLDWLKNVAADGEVQPIRLAFSVGTAGVKVAEAFGRRDSRGWARVLFRPVKLSVVDISELELELLDVFNKFGIGIIYLDVDKRIVWTNKRVNDMAGLSLEDCIGMDCRKLGERANLGTICNECVVDRAMATRETVHDRRVIVVDGVERSYIFSAFPCFDPEGKLTGVVEVLGADATHLLDDWNRDRELADQIFGSSPNGILIYSPAKNRFIQANPEACRQFGLAADEVARLPIGDILHGDDLVRFRRNFDAKLADSNLEAWRDVMRYRAADGSYEKAACACRLLPSFVVDGQATAVCIFQNLDASELSRHLAETRARFNLTLDAFQDGLWERDVATGKVFYSASHRNMFGYEVTELIGDDRPWFSFIHPEDHPRVIGEWQRHLDTGGPYRTEYRVRHKDGSWRWCLSTLQLVVKNDKGEPERELGLHVDVTDLRRTERDLADAEERLRVIFENAGIGIAIVNPEGRFEKVNPALVGMLRYEGYEFYQRSLAELAHSEDKLACGDFLRRLVRNGSAALNVEKRFVAKNGEVVWVNVTGTLSRGDDGGIKFIILLMEDITERRRLESKLQFDATHDRLTGAFNRGVLMENLARQITLAKRHHHELTFAICDLDHFKLVNDTYGHQAGDLVLSRFVMLLQSAVRTTDIIGRYGGEEFGIIFPETGTEGAAVCLERARNLLKAATFSDGGGRQFKVTATFGLARLSETSTPDGIVSEADNALYRGKAGGRDRIVVF